MKIADQIVVILCHNINNRNKQRQPQISIQTGHKYQQSEASTDNKSKLSCSQFVKKTSTSTLQKNIKQHINVRI